MWFRRNEGRDLQAFFDSIATIKAGRGGYSKMDRYRDFRAVFTGTSTPEQGKRVLAQIIAHCEGLPLIEADAEQAHKLVWRAATRSVGLQIVKWLNSEPDEPMEKQNGGS